MSTLLSVPNGLPVVATVGELSVVAGPDAGRMFPVTVGHSILGRAESCDLTIRDDQLESHHLLLEAKDTGVVWLTQLSGRMPVLVDGQPTERALLTAGTDIELGATRLDWCRASLQLAGTGATSTPMPTIGLVDSADRAFGLDTGHPSRRRGQTVALSPGLRDLTIVGSDRGSVGPCLRAIVGQFAKLGWSVHSDHADARCTLNVDSGDGSSKVQRPRVIVVDAAQRGDGAFDHERDGTEVVISVTDDETGLDATGNTGAVIVVGRRCRGRYAADARQLATIRLHLVGWHPTTFASIVNGAMRGAITPR